MILRHLNAKGGRQVQTEAHHPFAPDTHRAPVCLQEEEQKEGEWLDTIPHCWLFMRGRWGLTESTVRRYNSRCQSRASLALDTVRPVFPPPFTLPAKTMNSLTLAAIRHTSAYRAVLCRLRATSFPEVLGSRWLSSLQRNERLFLRPCGQDWQGVIASRQSFTARVCGCLCECVKLSRRVSWGWD